ncbi:MAG: MBL fold metallo-hydrolase [Spongiibacteraceae bacterium]
MNTQHEFYNAARFAKKSWLLNAAIISMAVVLPGCSRHDALQDAAKQIDATGTQSIAFSGTGKWYQFGQAPNPTSAWPQFDVSSYSATINYDTQAARVQIVRKQTIEAGRERPAPVEQKPDQYVSKTVAWNLAAPQGAPADAAPAPQPQPAAVEERSAEIWSTPQGFLRAAITNNAEQKANGDKTDVKFSVGNYRYEGVINKQNQVESVKTWIDNPVLGDTEFETAYSDYKDFNGVSFPSHIVRTQGGYPVLDLTIGAVTKNAAAEITVPQEISSADATKVNVTSEQLAEGVYYLRGGSHHSVVIEQADHIVIVEAPQHEARSNAVIAKAKELIPNKPIAYLVNTHHHFDHSGGLRTYVDEGATIVTHADNKPYYEKVWSRAHSINPDRLAASKKAAKFETFTDSYALYDGKRKIEIHTLAGNGHNDAFALIYLPAEKILIEADAYTPLAPNAPRPASVNPYAVNLHENIKKLNLNVDRIAALHGPGIVKLADLEDFISAKTASR